MKTIQETITTLENIVSRYTSLLQAVSEADYIVKPVPGKWSKKELLGHLVDSAQNNIRRFVMAQYEALPKVVYAQDEWVAIANYQHYPTPDLITLWTLLNKHTSIVLKNIPDGDEKRECITNEPRSIEWIAADYIKHLLHHLHQILNLEPISYP